MELIKSFPEYVFIPGDCNMWSPHSRTIMFDIARINTDGGRLALLHEIGHARLNHRLYRYDLELLRMEIEAWMVALELAPQFGLEVNRRHIDRAISSYDRWLTKRATCPDCGSFGVQRGRDQYGCFECGTRWHVNWRKDRRVQRTITSRFTPTAA